MEDEMGTEKRVSPYLDGVQTRRVLKNFVTYEYVVPFNYDNIRVVRRYNCAEPHGMEMNPVNTRYPDPNHEPSDYIEIKEDKPIVGVEVIGSACTPPGYVMLEADALDGFRRHDEPRDIMPVRFRVGNLWGMHLRADQWLVHGQKVKRFGEYPQGYAELPEGFKNLEPDLFDAEMKTDYHEFPLTGMSSARFSIPASDRIRVTAGSECIGWTDDIFPDDSHYSIRIIRVTVCDID